VSESFSTSQTKMAPSSGRPAVSDRRRMLHIIAGPAVFLALAVSPIWGLPYEIRCSVGLLAWMAWWWITRPVHLAVTGFLPLATVALFNFVPINRILPAYASELVILLLSANVLTTCWTRWGLDRRIALVSLCLGLLSG
jgi:sodium-dependent dicarboxylate transporter 2/3/5